MLIQFAPFFESSFASDIQSFNWLFSKCKLSMGVVTQTSCDVLVLLLTSLFSWFVIDPRSNM